MSKNKTKADIQFELEQAYKRIAELESAAGGGGVPRVSSDALGGGINKELLEATPDAMVIVDAGGKILMANALTEKMFGYAQSELVGEPVEILMPHPMRGEHVENRIQFMAQPQTVTTGIERDISAERKNGEKFPVEISLSHHKLAGDEMIVLCAIRDVTERQRARELITAQRDLARLISDGNTDERPCAFCLRVALRVSKMDSGGVYLFNEQSGAFELIHHQGLSAEFASSVGQFGEDTPNARMLLDGRVNYFTASDLEEIDDHRAEGLRSLAVIPIQYHGQVLGCLNIASHTLPSVPAWSRTALETLAVEIGNIITHRRTEESLKLSRAQLSQALVAARMGTWCYRISTARVEWSPEAAQIFGVDASQDDFNAILARFHPDDRERVLGGLQEVFAQKKVLDLEYRMFDADGNIHWITNYGHVECDADGNPLTIVGLVQDVTERKQAEQALRFSETKWHSLFETCPVGIALANAQGKFLDVNPAYLAQFGYTRDEIEKKHYEDFTPQKWHARESQNVAQIKATGLPVYFEKEHIRKDGTVFPVALTGWVIRDESGLLDTLGVFVQDITSIKQAELELRESEERHRLISEMTSDYVYVGMAFPDGSSQTAWISGAFERITGYSLDEIGQRPGGFSNLIFPEDLKKVIDQQPVLFETGTATAEYRIMRKDGEVRWLRDNMKLVEGDEYGKPARLLGAVNDITAQKQAEIALRESESRYRLLVETSIEGIWSMDREHRTTYVNQSMADMMGYAPAEILGRKVEEFFFPEDMGYHQTRMEKRHSGQDEVYERRFRRRDGSQLWTLVSARAQKDSQGNFNGSFAMFTDITERKQAEENIRESEERFSKIFLASPIGIILTKIEDGRILDVNNAFLEIFGREREEIIGNTTLDLNFYPNPGDRTRLMSILRDQGRIFGEEMGFRRSSGEIGTLYISAEIIDLSGKKVLLSMMVDITDRKQAQEQLSKNERILRLFVEHAPAAIAMFDREMRYIVNSKRYLTDFRLGSQDLAGRLHYDIFPEMDDERKEIHRRCLAGAVVKNEADMLPRADGTIDWVRYELRPWHETNGEIGGLIFFSEVITERKHAEEALNQSRALLTEAQRIGHIGHIEWNAGNQVLVCSEELYAILGLPRETVITKDTVAAMMTGEERKRIQQLDMQALQQREDMDYEYHIRLKDGGVRWLHQMCKITYDDAGVPIRMMAVIQDVTERKQAEETLRESRLRVEMALKGANVAMWDWNIKTGDTVFNERWAEMLGYTLRELEPISIQTWRTLCHPDDLKVSDRLLQRHFAGETNHYECEARMKHRNGSWVWVIDRGRVMEWDTDCTPLRMFGTHLDITERKREERYTQARLRLANLSYETLGMETLMRTMLDEAEALTDSQIGFFHFVDDDQNSIRLQTWSTNTLNTLCTAEGKGQHYPVAQAGVWADGIRSGEPRIYNDYAGLAHRRDLPEGHALVTRLISLPIKRNNLIVAAIGVGNKPTDYNEHDLEMVKRLAEDAFDIVLRKRVEQALRQSEERFRTVADFTYDLEYWMDENQRLVYISPSCERLTGYDRDEFMQNPALFETIVHPDDRPLYDRHLAEDFRALTPGSLDFRIITADGLERWVNHTCQGVYNGGGKSRGRRVSLRDITERIKSEEKIRQQMEDLAFVNLLNEAANRGESLERILEILRVEGRRIFGCRDVAVYLLSPDLKTVLIQYGSLSEPLKSRIEKLIGCPIPKLQIPIQPGGFFHKSIHSEQGMITTDPKVLQAWIAEFAETPFLPELARSGAKALIPQIFKLLGIRSVITIPLKSENRILGALEISSAGILAEQDLERLQNIRASLTEILKRKQVEQDLMESEEKYRGLMESLNNGIATVDFNGRFLYMNDMGAERLGGLPQELIGKTLMELFSEPVARRQLAAIQNVFLSDRETVLESQSGRNGETDHWYRFALQPLHDEDGRVEQVLVNATDIHDLKTAQQELQELNRTLEEKVAQRTAEVQDLYNNAPTGYHSLDAGGNFVMVNQTELNWLGYTREEVLGHAARDYMTEESKNTFRENFPLFLQRGWLKDLELEFVCRDGSILPVSLSATAIHDQAGNFVMSRSTLFDITERKRAENDLRESEEQNRLLFEVSPVPIALLGETGQILRANRAYEQLTGIPWSGLYGKTSVELGLVDAQVINDLTQAMLDAISKKENFTVMEHSLTSSDGTKRFVESRVFLLPINSINHILVTTNDISTYKKAEETLRRANIELERAISMKDEFLATMSHELRTPLTGILGLSEALQMEVYGGLNDRQVKTVNNIENSGRHLLALINDVLDLSKVEAGKLELQIERCSLEEICQASLQLTKGMAHQKGQHVNYSAPVTPIILDVDARRIKQVLVNLFSNAIKFTPENGELGLTVEPDEENCQVRLIVWDKGIGIKSENLSKLFQPFTQIDGSLAREYTGTGLGLALVRRLVEFHNGGVEVESVFGEGSRFIVTLPWTPQEVRIGSSVAGDLEESFPETADKNSSSPMILVADDNQILLDMLGDFLEAQQYRITKVRSGQELLEKIASIEPDIILMDIQMPGMDGLEAIRLVRNHKDAVIASAIIIAVTALAMPGDRERCLDAGANEYMSKPVNLRKLVAVIQDFTGTG